MTGPAGPAGVTGPAGPAADGAARNRQVFRSPGAVVTWYVWLLFAAANLVDLGVRGHDHTAAVYAAVLALITGVVYIAALRPRVIADDDAVTLRDPLRDTRIPWGAVTRIDLRELVCFHVQIQPTERAGAPPRHRVVRSWALQSSRRGRARARGQARRRDAEFTRMFARQPPQLEALTAQSTAAVAIVELDQRRSMAHERGAERGDPIVAWSRVSLAALAAPAVLVALVAAIH